ncbi:D-alanyl-D-alanine carboxypeptidase family protein [Pelagibacterium limicola]|uniref:D-alanyl-D-alanine carboxypeptidase family protein n=1 Tax=Pelagibacterium limicola TaxID=2791022 RepID=UPI0018AF751B|nr:D-alanyl-D-alanine carboxypeptidase family protein [Pelagibacterium limicola]
MVGANAPALAQADFETAAPYAILMDHESGAILYQRGADERVEPASMAKLMTVAVALDLVRQGALDLEDTIQISEHAWRTGGAPARGTTMFAELGSRVRVDDLLHSTIIQSGNDATIALAEGIAGSETAFAGLMNQFAIEIGLKNSHFTNPSGLPDPEMYSTVRDLALLARYIIREFPDYYPVFSEEAFEWNGIYQRNRNDLVGQLGIDGLKTGSTNAAGHGVVVSTTEGERRLVGVVHGLATAQQRTDDMRRLITWGTTSFERLPAFAEGSIIGHASVYGGADSQVGLVGERGVDIFLLRGNRQCLRGNITYRMPILPPVKRGDQIAHLNIFCDDQLVQAVPLYAAEDVEVGGIVRRATDALWELAFGWLPF